MCCQNFHEDIVETRYSHTYPDTEADKLHNKVFHRKLGLPDDAPRWLEWKVISYPHGRAKRGYIRKTRNTMKMALRNAITHGDDLEDFQLFDLGKYDGRDWWY